MWQFGVEMNLDKIKARVDEISRSTGVKNPKVLVADLCGVIKSLIGEIEKIKNPPMAILSTLEDMPRNLPEDFGCPIQTEPFELPPISRQPSVLPPKRCEGNVGDAE